MVRQGFGKTISWGIIFMLLFFPRLFAMSSQQMDTLNKMGEWRGDEGESDHKKVKLKVVWLN